MVYKLFISLLLMCLYNKSCSAKYMFSSLLSGGSSGSDGLTPVNPSRFQVLDVDERCDIRSFVQKNSLVFKQGQGFYEFTKPEKISDKKEVVLVDKVGCDYENIIIMLNTYTLELGCTGAPYSGKFCR